MDQCLLGWVRWEREGEGSLEAPVCSEQVTPFSPVLSTNGHTHLSRDLFHNTDKCEAGVPGQSLFTASKERAVGGNLEGVAHDALSL